MKRVALFVGINTYPDAPLSCARADAESLYREFCGMYDTTSLLVDESASPENVVREIVKCRNALLPGDMFLFYFSGHGCEQDGDRMLAIPEYDVQGNDLGLSGLALSTLKEMTDIRGLHRLFVLDCCRNVVGHVNNPGARGKMAGYLYRHGKRSLIQPTILSSSAPGQSSYEHSGSGHGYFTEAFLAAIRNSDVRSFNMFRDRLDFEMQLLRTPAAQDPYFEGGIGSNLPFWPMWDSNAEVAHATPPADTRRTVTLADVVIAFRGLSDSAFYVGDAIPPEKRRNAWNAMQVKGYDSSLLALFDNTFWGGSRKGFVLTADGLYARNNDAEPPFFCPWGKIKRVDCKDKYIVINDHLVDTLFLDDEFRGKCTRAISMLAKKILRVEHSSTDIASGVPPVEDEGTHSSLEPETVLQVSSPDVHTHETETVPEQKVTGRKIPCRKKKSDYPHVLIANADGELVPEPGYVWNSGASRDLGVKWSPGIEHPGIPHVVASASEGRWIPARGYVWNGPRSVKKK